jgi:hypothetical protein
MCQIDMSSPSTMKERTHMFGPTCRPKSPNGEAHMFGPTCRPGYALEGKKGVEIRYRKWLLLDPLPSLHPYLNLTHEKSKSLDNMQLSIGNNRPGRSRITKLWHIPPYVSMLCYLGDVWFKSLVERSDSVSFLMCLVEMKRSGEVPQKRIFCADAEAVGSKKICPNPLALVYSITFS